MINLEYVNGSISLEVDAISKPFESFMESCKHDINNIFVDFDMLEEKVALESAIMGSAPESMVMVYESEKKNIFTKIGEMVVAIYNKFVEFIDNIVDAIKTYAFKKKSDLQKLDILLKNHPDLKDEAIAAFHEGALDLSDVRSLKELDSAFDEILQMSKKKDIDPKTLRGKWEKAKEKFEKDEKSWKVVKVAAATTTVITAAIALKTFTSKCAKAQNDAIKDKQEMRERKAKILSELIDKGVVTEDTGKFRTMLEIWRELNGKHSAHYKGNASVISKFANGITSFIDRFDKDGGKRLQYDLKTTKSKMDKAAEDAEKSELEKIKRESRARKEAERQDAHQHQAYDLRRETMKAKAQADGRNLANSKKDDE